MKKVIALRGRAKVGKSQTIRKVYDLLLSDYPTAESSHLKIGVDVRVILTIKGTRVGLESQGDPGGRLEKSLDLFVREGCRVIICSTRTYGSTVEAVKRLQLEEQYDLLWIDQAVVSNALEQQPKNLETASKILAEVKQAIAFERATTALPGTAI